MKKIEDMKELKNSIEEDLGELKTQARRYAKYFWFFPIYILGYVLIERFPVMQHYHVMHCALDDMIPFCEYFVVPYFMWHLAIVVFAIYTFRRDPARFEKLLRFFIVCCFIVFPIYVFFPSCQNLRPVVFSNSNFFTRWVQWTYLVDTNTNVCPSMHVIGCVGLLFTCWNMKGLNDRKGHIFQVTLAVLISMSTVFIKQHSCLDVAAAVPVSLLGWWISYGDARSFENRKLKELAGVIFVKGKIFTIPNIMSFFRICLVPVILVVYVKYKRIDIAIALIALSGLTDVVDGMVARKFNMVSDLGKILDPIADKLTQLALLWALATQYPLMWLLILIILFKECVQGIFGYIMLQRHALVQSSQWFGKASTVVLYATVIGLLLFPGVTPVVADTAIGICAGFLLLALIMYSRHYLINLYPDVMYKIRDGAFKALGIAMWVVAVYLIVVNRDKLTAEGIAGSMPDNLFIAALIMMGAFAVKSLTMVFSSAILFAASAVIFPIHLAVIVNLAGVLVMTTIPYYIGVRGGRAELDRLCEKHPKIRRLETTVIENEFLFTLMLRINGAVNYDAGSMYLGARNVSGASYYLGSILGMLPQVIIYTLFGVGINNRIYWLSAVVIAVKIVLTVLSTVFFGRWFRLAETEDEKDPGKDA